jgi:3-oxoacyl-[acyl-carrier-protein] synthase III
MNGSKILAIEYYLPKKKENNKSLKKFNPQLDIKRIYEKTGINTRYISGEKESVIDISIKCSNKIFKKFPKKKIDFLILVTQTSPYRIPTTACILQEKLNLKKNIIAFDINLGCSGFIYALRMGSSLIESKQANNGLIICADTYTKYISKKNTACRPIFSDAGAAILLSRSLKNMIGPFELGADGSGADALELPMNTNEIIMNGAKVLTFAMNVVPNNVNLLLKKIKINKNKIDKFIFHQASKYILDNINRILSIKKEQTFENYSKVGNTISASIPIALKDANTKNKLKKNNNIIIAGYGVGLSWGSALIKWHKIK